MVFTKVCGITNPGDAREAADAGADAIGLIFAESPREVNVEEARRISVALPDGVLKVGVFVDAEPEEVWKPPVRSGWTSRSSTATRRPRRWRPYEVPVSLS